MSKQDCEYNRYGLIKAGGATFVAGFLVPLSEKVVLIFSQRSEMYHNLPKVKNPWLT